MRRTSASKRILAILLAVLMVCTSIQLSAFAGAGGEVRVIPTWFDADKYSVWWATDQAGASGSSWRFTVARAADKWTYTMHSNQYDAGFAESNSAGVDVNVNNTPYLNFKVRSSRDTALYINVLRKNGADDYSDKTEIKLADLKAGVAAEVQIAFADLPGLSALVNDEGVFHLGGTGFKTAGFGENDTFEYDHFYATSQKAEGGEMKVAPACFDADKTSSWYASDQYDGTENWRCLITVADGVWTYRLKDKGGWDAGYVEANKNLITVDTAVTPYLNYKVKADKDTTLYIGKRVNDDWVRIPYATVKAGVLTEGQVKIADIPGIGEYLQDGRLVLDSTGFETGSFAAGDTFEYHAFYATNKKAEGGDTPGPEPEDKPGDDVVYPSWLTEAESGNWWDWDWNSGGGAGTRFFLSYTADGSVVLKYAGPFNDIKLLGTRYTLDLEKTPYLYVDVTSEFPTDLRLVVDGGSHDGVKLFDTFEGRKTACVDLRRVEGLKSSIRGGKLSLVGFTYRQADGTDTDGKTLTIRAFDFAGEGKTYPAARPAAPSIALSTEAGAQALDVSVTAPEGAQRVQYRIGSSGDYQEYTEPVRVTKNVPVYARYFSAEGFWSMTALRRVTNIILPEPDPDAGARVPNWFDPANKKLWYNWDWQVDSNDENRFKIDYEGDAFKVTFGQPYAQSLSVNQNQPGAHMTINLADQNALHYKINTDLALKVYLRVLKSADAAPSSYTSVYVGEIPAGKSADSLYLADNTDLLALCDEDYNLIIASVEFTQSPSVGDTVTIERFLFDDEDAYYEGYPDSQVVVKPITPDWFSVFSVNDWFAGDKANGSGFEVSFTDDNVWQAAFGTATAIHSEASPVKLHLKRNNTLYYRLRATEAVKLSLILAGNGGDVTVHLADIPAGRNSGSLSLADNERLAELGPKLTLKGARLESAAGAVVNVDLFILDAADVQYDGYPDEAQIAADKAAADKVVQAIASLGEITLDKADAVRAARALYEALTSAQKIYVSNFGLLAAAESRLEELLLADTGSVMNRIPEAEILDFMDENPGKKVIINLNRGDKLSPAVLAKARATDSDIVVKMIDPATGKIDYMITIFSENILDPSKGLDTALRTSGADIDEALKAFAPGAASGFYLDMADGCVKLTVTVYTDSPLFAALSGAKTVGAYRYDAGAFTSAARDMAANEGMVAFDVEKGGVYALSAGSPEGGAESPDTGAEIPTAVRMAAVLGGLTVCCAALRGRKRGKKA